MKFVGWSAGSVNHVGSAAKILHVFWSPSLPLRHWWKIPPSLIVGAQSSHYFCISPPPTCIECIQSFKLPYSTTRHGLLYLYIQSSYTRFANLISAVVI